MRATRISGTSGATDMYTLDCGSSDTPTTSLEFDSNNDAFYRTAEAITRLDGGEATCAWVSLKHIHHNISRDLVNWTKTSDERPYTKGEPVQ